MDTGLKYQTIVKNILQEYREFMQKSGDEDSLRVLFDDEHKAYALLSFGWQGQRYIHAAIVHMDIIEEKVWIQCDNTEQGIALELVEKGIPKEQIILGFRPAHLRQHTGFGV